MLDAANGLRRNRTVALRGAEIAQITTGDAAERFTAHTVIDGTGKYLIPGLWDAHVHLSYAPGIDHHVFFPLALAHGVTSLRDTGGHLDLLEPARAAAKEDPITPDLYISGPLIDGPLRVYAGQAAGFPDLSIGVATPAQAAQRVDDLARAGVHFVKAYEMLAPEVFAAVAEQAAQQGLKVAAHVPLSMSVEDAARAGADDLQHLRNLEMSCAANAAELKVRRRVRLTLRSTDNPAKLRQEIHAEQRGPAVAAFNEQACQAMVDVLAVEQVFQTPTLTVARIFTHKLFVQDAYRQSFDLMPGPIAKVWRERSSALSNRPLDAATRSYDDFLIKVLNMVRARGVPIMAGTDAPIAFLTPGASLHAELALLVDAGLTPLEALKAATLTPAEFFGEDDVKGSIAPGMKADLVLLNANPLDDIRNVSAIDSVIKDGIVLRRSTLDELLLQPSTDLGD
ncbi:MAG: amidohydrolase family protein [Pseudomonadota bacterium]